MSLSAKLDVCNALHKMAERNDIIQDTHGNVSQRDGDYVYIKPSGVSYERIQMDDVCIVSMNSRTSCGNKLVPSVDTVHHIEIYKRYPHVKAICHTHSPYATASSIKKYDVEMRIPCYLTEHADYFGHDIRMTTYMDLNSWGRDLTLFQNEKAIILGNHGVLTFGDDALEAVEYAVALENICKKYYIATVHSIDWVVNKDERQLYQLPKEEVDKWHDRYVNGYGQKKNDTDSE